MDPAVLSPRVHLARKSMSMADEARLRLAVWPVTKSCWWEERMLRVDELLDIRPYDTLRAEDPAGCRPRPPVAEVDASGEPVAKDD